MRNLTLAFAALLLPACSNGSEEPRVSAESPVAYRVVRLEYDVAHLRPLTHDSAGELRVIHQDSLSKTIRTGEVVEPCYRPTRDGRVVTFCRGREEAP